MEQDSTVMDGRRLPQVSIVIIARNEERFIEKAISSLLSRSRLAQVMEVLVVDGRSDDATVAVVEKLRERTGWPIRVLDNPRRLPPHGLNIGVSQCRGDYVLRADAHSEYPPDYIDKLIQYAREYPEADNVGGVFDIRPSTPGYMARAIAAAYSHRFATGNALYRTGVRKPTFVDTVPFGFFRRDVFDKYGLYDTDLIRNEDGEFNHRIIRGGGKVLLVPDISIRYYARPGLRMLAKTFFQFGWFKPLAQRKLRRPVNHRQFAPLGFLMMMTALAIAGTVSGSWALQTGAVGLAGVYLLASAASAIGAVGRRGDSPALVPGICAAFWTMHLCFALGYIKGIVGFLLLNKHVSDVPMTR